MHHRLDHVRALTDGLTAKEYAPRGKAAAEIGQLWQWVLSIRRAPRWRKRLSHVAPSRAQRATAPPLSISRQSCARPRKRTEEPAREPTREQAASPKREGSLSRYLSRCGKRFATSPWTKTEACSPDSPSAGKQDSWTSQTTRPFGADPGRGQVAVRALQAPGRPTAGKSRWSAPSLCCDRRRGPGVRTRSEPHERVGTWPQGRGTVRSEPCISIVAKESADPVGGPPPTRSAATSTRS